MNKSCSHMRIEFTIIINHITNQDCYFKCCIHSWDDFLFFCFVFFLFLFVFVFFSPMVSNNFDTLIVVVDFHDWESAITL